MSVLTWDGSCARTRQPVSARDPSSTHIGVNLDGDPVYRKDFVVEETLDFSDGQIWNAWLEHNDSELEVYLSTDISRPADPVLSTDIDIPGLLGDTNDDTVYYAGFTGATGAAYEGTCILDWNYTGGCNAS